MVMKLLKDIKLDFYCIKVNYFMWSEERGDYTEPKYLTTNTTTLREDGTSANIITFKDTITENLRIFDTRKEANHYIGSRLENVCNCDMIRPVKITYDQNLHRWIEVLE